jgi:sugar lactone lactonase YvrE
VLGEVNLDAPYASFNDLTVSVEGRLYLDWIEFDPGHSAPTQLGSLLMIDLEGSVRIVASDLEATNELGSPQTVRSHITPTPARECCAVGVRGTGPKEPLRVSTSVLAAR